MREELIAAINGRYPIEVFYPPGYRVIEPHAIGYSKAGNLIARCYQSSGASASGEHEHWELFSVKNMSSGSGPVGGSFEPRLGYNPNDPAMKGGIIASV
jgi:hypothetical protein